MARFLGDDILGRAEWVAGRSPFVDVEPPDEPLKNHIAPLSHAHCEAMTEIAQRAGIDFGERLVAGNPRSLPKCIAALFEYWDGTDFPSGRKGNEIDTLAQITAIASDIENFSRNYGIKHALDLINARSGQQYNPQMVAIAIAHAEQWLKSLEGVNVFTEALISTGFPFENSSLSVDDLVILLSDYAAVKHPDSMQLSRRASEIAEKTAKYLGLNTETPALIKRATLLHRLGFVSVSNKTLYYYQDNESYRLAPYWTERILKQAPALQEEAQLASMAYECLDGSGYYRGLTADNLLLESRIVQAAVAAATLQITEGNKDSHVSWYQILTTQSDSNLLDPKVTEALIACQKGRSSKGVKQ